ncbi:hypothetical protein SAMN05216583_1701, partial [Selenomonas sp. KH1T6]
MSVIPLMHSPFSLLMYKKFLFVVKSTKN